MFGLMNRNVFCTRFSDAMSPPLSACFTIANCCATNGSWVEGSPFARAISSTLTMRMVLSSAL